MLARRSSLTKYEQWNHEHGSPHGTPSAGRSVLGEDHESRLRREGAFSIQPNNTTREFEYPWATEVAQLRSGMNVVEVGGGLSGFQFVLCQTGCQVINVDPGIDGVAPGWACDHASMRRLNRAFGTSVELRRCTMGNAGLEPDSFDRAFSLSVLEHLPEAEAAEVLRGVHDCLKPGGLFVLTIDLFLDLKPFTALTCNRYGTNVDVSSLLRFAPFDRILGRPEELYGFPEFDAQRVLEQVDTLVVGRRHPVLVQCLILQKKKGRARDA